MAELWQRIEAITQSLMPVQDMLTLNRRQKACLQEACDALTIDEGIELLLVAEHLRLARHAIDRLLGRTGVEDMLDALFAGFCIGK
jgi:tRNA modification GTPase